MGNNICINANDLFLKKGFRRSSTITKIYRIENCLLLLVYFIKNIFFIVY